MSVNEKQVAKAVKALLAYEKKKASAKEDNSSNLLDDTDAKGVHLIVTTRKMPEKLRVVPQRIPLKHPLYADSEVCLITKDPQRTFKTLLEEKNVKGLSRVIGVQKVKAKFHPYEAKRKLCASYDLFLADERVLPVLPAILGKTFFKTKKHPAPVNMTKTNLAGEIQAAIHSTYLIFNSGVCNAVKIGKTSFTSEEITENILFAIPEIVKRIPKQWHNILSIQVKTSDSLALPVYSSLPEFQEPAAPAEAKATPAAKKIKA
ncbi:ribosomal protein L1/ribosomal biogenesis protein [Phlyctochytrium arcticum]|nr:ribosomal protein L1/ribosomal biogenesis protein [Phlyctochytrium arcticum]